MADKRFYLAHYENQPDREVLFVDIGNLLKISGVLYQGMGSNLLLLSPSADDVLRSSIGPVLLRIEQPSVEEWSEIIRQSDDPEMFIGEVGGVNKILHRKQRFEISGHVQQKVWARDGFSCIYCNRRMGDVQLTIDHWISLENGGVNDDTNYVSACRKCNKSKGSMDPKDFCEQYGHDYAAIDQYVQNLKLLR